MPVEKFLTEFQFNFVFTTEAQTPEASCFANLFALLTFKVVFRGLIENNPD